MKGFTKKMIAAKTIEEKVAICEEFENRAIEQEDYTDIMYYMGYRHGLMTAIGK